MPSRMFGDIQVELSNLDKVLYPATGTTKQAVIDYYVAIAPAMIPHIAGRPVTRKRWPNGIESTPFFEKNLADHAPDWIERRGIEHRSRTINYPVFDTVAGLAWLGQQASLEIHVPQWRFDADGDVGPATRLVFDLDPGEGITLAECAQVAVAVRDMVGEIDLVAFPVTSGSKGIHVYVPLDRALSPGGASKVARQVADNLEKLHPDLVTATMAKVARRGKVFLDWSQNNPAKTTIAPYSMRGRAEPTAAAPRTWAELENPAELRHLRFDEVLDRFRRYGDLLHDLDPSGADKLARYRSMRNPELTPEPVPAAAPKPSEGNAFVIHEHHARRLHWDVRLERDGVLACWAVPKGVPETPAENRLAVHTEDHPIEYLDFSATIPKGQYGGGVMTIWDTGTYETEKWRDDEVIIRLHGQQVQGRFALIRTGGKNWLMHRMKSDSETDSGTALPRGLAPMLATTGTVDGLGEQQWCFEAKWDGYRLIAEIDRGELKLRSRAGNVVTDRYPGLQQLATELADHRVVLDGEVVVFDERGIPDFGKLQVDGKNAEFLVFDILHLDGTSLLRKKFEDRRKVLEALAEIVPSMQVPPLLDGSGAEALAQSREQGWEGVVAKRRESVYLVGKRGHSWVKAKNWRTQEVVIGGWKRGQGGRSGRIGSLLLGVPDADGALHYVGKVGTGFTERTLESLAEQLKPLARDDSPFATALPAAERRDAVWVAPELVGEVRFGEWTGSDRLRHPAWRGLRDDKKPDEVRREG
ncbi:ATP-dependent DNA ligase [Aldersonia sp. NBC_00410]|uniref:ATP-dependent DNA ligase n=1 Tax=Aldersonia sp. NBC_00410 TaxID=2975954 RepID=UPI002253C479|nr:ATP-dependent DNA ligase [Aldersonia sp. NBC_00410]MCX5045650.1 ATP-dependent DNA ligase [Aldersonia sp. NBC_00410]